MSLDLNSDHTSFSQVRRYEQCPKSFELHYRKRLPVLPSEPAMFGKVMHAACEVLVRDSIASGAPSVLSREQATAAFEHAWSESGLTGLALFHDGVKMITDFALDQGVVDQARILAVEQRFLVPAGRHAVLGFIDRVDRIDDESIEIIDYKSNQQLFTREELENDLQLPLYAAAAQQLWPWAKNVRLTFWMLRHRVRVPVRRTPDQIASALAYVETMAEKAASATEFAAKLGAHCVYCDHREGCEAYASALQGTRRFVCADAKDIEAVAREREEVAGLARILDGRKKELELLLKSRLNDTDELRAASMRYRMVPTRSAANYPVEATLDALTAATGRAREDIAGRLAVIDNEALEGLLDELAKAMPKARLTLLRAELDARATRAVAPRFMATKAK